MNKKQDIVATAKLIKAPRFSNCKYKEEDAEELAVAWARGEISMSQLTGALGIANKGSAPYIAITKAMRRYFSKNK